MSSSKYSMFYRRYLPFAEELSGLVKSAIENGVTFVYAISPGLDITYSSQEDRDVLKAKLDQVSFGAVTFLNISNSNSNQNIYSSTYTNIHITV